MNKQKIPNELSNCEPVPRFVDATEIAKNYSVTPRYVLRLAAEGRIPCLRVGKKCVRFIEADVAAALKGAMAD